MMKISVLFLALIPLFGLTQSVSPTPEYIKSITPLWTGVRTPDGRPRLDDKLLERLKGVSIEEAWGYLRNKGFQNQFEGDCFILRPEQPMVGRVVTAQYAPLRPDLEKVLKDQGTAEGRVGAMNSWPIDVLKTGDIYLADSYGKIVDGTLIGDNLGNAIYAKSKNGVVFNGSVRDIAGLEEIEGFNAFIKGHDPSYIQQMMRKFQNQKPAGRSSPGQKKRGRVYSSSPCGGPHYQFRVYSIKRSLWSSKTHRRQVYSRGNRHPLDGGD